jgi:hypothetical protein
VLTIDRMLGEYSSTSSASSTTTAVYNICSPFHFAVGKIKDELLSLCIVHIEEVSLAYFQIWHNIARGNLIVQCLLNKEKAWYDMIMTWVAWQIYPPITTHIKLKYFVAGRIYIIFFNRILPVRLSFTLCNSAIIYLYSFQYVTSVGSG